MKSGSKTKVNRGSMLKLALAGLICLVFCGCAAVQPDFQQGSLAEIKHNARQELYQECVSDAIWSGQTRITLMEVISMACREFAQERIKF